MIPGLVIEHTGLEDFGLTVQHFSMVTQLLGHEAQLAGHASTTQGC